MLRSTVKVHLRFHVRQGGNMSPMLFAIYLNDLENFFCQSGIVNGVTCVSENVINDA